MSTELIGKCFRAAAQSVDQSSEAMWFVSSDVVNSSAWSAGVAVELPLRRGGASTPSFGSGSLVDCVYDRRTRIFGSCGRALACSIAQFLDHCVLSSHCCMAGGATAGVTSPPLFRPIVWLRQRATRPTIRSVHGIRCPCMPLETWLCQLTECGRLGTVDRFGHAFVGGFLALPSQSRHVGHVVLHSQPWNQIGCSPLACRIPHHLVDVALSVYFHGTHIVLRYSVPGARTHE